MGNCFSTKSLEPNRTTQPSHQVNPKDKPTIIPAKAIKKLDEYNKYSGGLGDVWRCSWHQKSGKCKVAVKSIRIPQSDDEELVEKIKKRIRHEARIWMKLKHENILEFHGIVEGFGLLPALVSPWMENGSLDHYLKKRANISSAEALGMLRQIAAGLEYLHGEGVVHGDLTCTNVLMSGDGKLYLADFGLSTILAESQNSTLSSCHPGNVRWMAPEMLATSEQGEAEAVPTKVADIYSYGCIMLQLFSGQQPYFWLKQAMSVSAARIKGTAPFRASKIAHVEDYYKEYSLRCLSIDIRNRPDVSGIVKFLSRVR